jgi:serine/threonine-protein kinase
VPAKKLSARIEKKLERVDKPQAAVAPGSGGRVELAVAPWGEVLVDGKSRGLSPPLRVLDLVPGAHTVEIRNSTFPAYVEKVQIKPGEAVKIRHRFR